MAKKVVFGKLAAVMAHDLLMMARYGPLSRVLLGYFAHDTIRKIPIYTWIAIIIKEDRMTVQAKAAEAAPEKKGINRREFLNFAWLASLGFLTVNLGGITYLFSMPRFKEGEFGGKFTIGSVSEIPAVGASPVNFPKVKLWLSNTDQGIMAIYKVCTHLGCLYNWDDQEARFKCPCHGSQFQPDGTWIQGPAPRSLDRFVVELVDPDSGQVISTTNEEGDPLPVPENAQALIRVDTGTRIQGKPHG